MIPLFEALSPSFDQVSLIAKKNSLPQSHNIEIDSDWQITSSQMKKESNFLKKETPDKQKAWMFWEIV